MEKQQIEPDTHNASFKTSSDSYFESLKTIKNVKFTRREIEIIACIAHTRGTSKIASLLSIASRTVETHIANIMRKMDCNSREGIIDFIEKSGKYALVRKQYQDLIVEAIFRKNLKKVLRHTTDKKESIRLLIYGKEKKSTDILISRLEKHLNILRLKTAVEEKERITPYLVYDRDSQQEDYVIYLTALSLDEENMVISEVMQCISQNLGRIICILLDNDTHIQKELTNVRSIDFLSQQDYYSSFFTLLDLLFSAKEIRRIGEEFLDEVEKIRFPIEVNVGSLPIERDTSLFSKTTIFEIFLKKIFPNIVLNKFIFPFKNHYEESPISSLNTLNARLKEKTSKSRILKKKLWVFPTTFMVLLGVLVGHFFEKEALLKEIVGINEVWIQTYEPHLLQATLQVEFYQLRGNVLNFSQARKNVENVEKLFYELNKDLDSIKKRKNFSNINFWIWSPFNWPLKNKILSTLEEQKFAMFITLSLNKVSKLMAQEIYPSTIEEINNNIIPELKAALGKNEHNKRRGHLFKKWLAIVINMKSIARRMLVEDKEKDKYLYRKILHDICLELSLSLKDYDSFNFNTYIIMHYIKLMLTAEEVDPNEKKKLEMEAEYYLAQGAERAPKELAVLSAQGWHYIQKKEYDKALIALDAYLKIDPSNIAVLHNRAQACLELGEKIKSPECYHKAYIDAINANDLKPNDCNVIRLLVWSSLYVKGCKEAINKYQKLYKPLCVDGKQAWDNVSAIRSQEAKQLETKINHHCNLLNGRAGILKP